MNILARFFVMIPIRYAISERTQLISDQVSEFIGQPLNRSLADDLCDLPCSDESRSPLVSAKILRIEMLVRLNVNSTVGYIYFCSVVPILSYGDILNG
jgi:hypothetical protein